MLATVRATVLPGFWVEVYPTYEECAAQQGYVLTLCDGTRGELELLFPSAQDLRAFLTDARDGFAAARQMARTQSARRRPHSLPSRQATLF